jgi:predicted N-acetyltransferase YhbS
MGGFERNEMKQSTITIKKGSDLSKNELDIIAKANVKNFTVKCKDYDEEIRLLKEEEGESIFFFVKDGSRVVSLGLLKPIKIKYLGKNYNFLGIGNIISIEKGKGYGTILMKEILRYLKEKNITGIGFSRSEIIDFYRKAGFMTSWGLKRRFFYDYGDKEKNKSIVKKRYGIYFDGRDKLVSKLLKTKIIVKIPCGHW